MFYLCYQCWIQLCVVKYIVVHMKWFSAQIKQTIMGTRDLLSLANQLFMLLNIHSYKCSWVTSSIAAYIG